MTESSEPGGREAKTPRLFATTHWSLVKAAGSPDLPESAVALERLCQAYWFPVYAYVRRWGHGPEDARDLTQDFFAQLLRENTIAAADPDRGRFRSFLLGVLKRFLIHARIHATAQKRGGATIAISWEQDLAEERYAREVRDELAPDELFDRRWATTVLEHALTRLEQEYVGNGKEAMFRRLKPFVLGDRGHPPWRTVGKSLGLSESALKSALHRLRWRFGEVVRAQISETLARAEDVDEELKHLLAVMSR
jgi:RNA polymerase sigma-70 factor (ECF subfamily)